MIDDSELIRKCISGDIDSYGEIVHRYQQKAYAVAIRFLPNTEEAKDAVQEAFVRSYRKLSGFNTSMRFAPWFFRILVNHCTDVARSSRMKLNVRLDTDVQDERDDASDGILRKDSIDYLLKVLSPTQRKVTIMRDLEGFSTAEISEILKMSPSTVRVHLARSRMKMKGAYERMQDNEIKS